MSASVSGLYPTNHFTYVQRLIGNSFQNGKTAAANSEIAKYNAPATDTFVRSATVPDPATYVPSGARVTARLGSGGAMQSAEDRAAWLKANPQKPTTGSDEWYAQQLEASKARLNAEHADWSHHDNPNLSYGDYFHGTMMQLYQDTVVGQAPPLTDIPSYTARSEYTLKAVLAHEGITLNDDEKFYITSENGRRVVSGLADKEKQKRIEEAINQSHIIGKDLGASVTGLETLNFINTDWAKEGVDFVDSQLRAILTQHKSTMQQELRDLLGINIDLSKIYLDENGVISGYPPEMEQIIGAGWNPNTRGEGISLSQLGMQVHHTLELVGRYGYDNIPDMDESDIYLSYSNQGGLQVLDR